MSPTKARKLVKVEVELDEPAISTVAGGVLAGAAETVVWTEEVKRESNE